MMNQEIAITDTERYNVGGAWSRALYALNGSPWEAGDIADTQSGEVGEALKYAYDKIGQTEDGVRAALRAATLNTSMVSPVDLVEMADAFQVYYDSFDEPLHDYLEEHYDGIRLEWLNEVGRGEIESAVCLDTEIWVDDEDLPGVYVFARP